MAQHARCVNDGVTLLVCCSLTDRYLLSVKYLEAVRKVAELPGTAIKYVPKNVSDGVSQPGNGAQSVAMGVGIGGLVLVCV